jgi:hypothetical protein
MRRLGNMKVKAWRVVYILFDRFGIIYGVFSTWDLASENREKLTNHDNCIISGVHVQEP